MSAVLTWYGHAALGLEIGGCRVLVDPYFSDNPAAAVRAEDVTADYILVTHGHGDHVGDSVAIAQRCGATVIGTSEVCRWLGAKGVKTQAQQPGGGRRYPFGYLKLTFALHGSSMPDGSYGGLAVGLLLAAPGGQKIYIAGDTGLFGDMRLIGEEGLDLAVLPIGDQYTMGPEDALRAVKLLQPRMVIPIHYDTWAFIQQDAKAWCERVAVETPSKAHWMPPGSRFDLAAG